MHWSSHMIMSEQIIMHFGSRFGDPLVVVDIGSQIAGSQSVSYRQLVPDTWRYIGVDLCSGRNVDLVMPSEFEIPVADASADLVISGQCIEHCRNPFRLVAEAVRILKPNGMMFLTAPAVWPEHKHPIDCFRFYPDGMRSVMEESGLEVMDAFLGREKTNVGGENPVAYDCWGIGRKP